MNIDHSVWDLPHILYHAGIWLLTAGILCGLLLAAIKFGARKSKFTDDEMKAAGLNRQQRREKKALGKRKKNYANRF